ncbi:transcription initiation factor IIF, beta subunit [Lipomyces arxii]|uniref:transcription initiation factor IIF, beta subunit n=1 Tax=Lipomyces arxii TaxID=56418 RepID=UPI0034CDA74E
MSFNIKSEQHGIASSVGYEDDVASLSPASDNEDGNGNENENDNEDMYEDSGDLDMAAAGTKVWLVRMPKFLRDRWLEMEDAGSDDLGTVRLRQDKPNDIRLILADTEATKDLPKEYKLDITNQNVTNTYVFAEENLARFGKHGAVTGASENNASSGPTGSSSMRADNSNKRKRYQPYSRVYIPKNTAIAGKVFHECSLTVSSADKSYADFVAQRQLASSTAPRPQVTLLTEIPGVTSALAGPSMREGNSMFMRSQKREKERAQAEGKAARIPKNELLDLLFKLFEEYDYWGMKGLRERTRQPEAYLKEVLEPIAILNKKGPYTSKYCLKPEYKGQGRSVVS